MDEPTGVPETPTVDTPQGTDTPTTVDYEARYKELQGDYTRKAQELARFQKDPEYRAQLFRELAAEQGYELQDTPEPEYDDPSDRLAAEIEALKAQFEQSQTQQTQAQQLAQLEQHVDTQLKQLGVDEADADWIVSKAMSLPPSENGMPDIAAAFQALQQRDEQVMKRWAQSKRAPHIPSGGKSGTQAPNLDDPSDRVAWMTQEWAAHAND